MTEDIERLKKDPSGMGMGGIANKAESDSVNMRLQGLNSALDSAQMENRRLTEDLTRQQTLYAELKKMRGKGEEMDLLQQYQEVRHVEEACATVL